MHPDRDVYACNCQVEKGRQGLEADQQRSDDRQRVSSANRVVNEPRPGNCRNPEHGGEEKVEVHNRNISNVRLGGLGNPVCRDAEMAAEPFEVLVEVEDVDPHMLGSSGDGQVGEGKSVGAVGAIARQLAHQR